MGCCNPKGEKRLLDAEGGSAEGKNKQSTTKQNPGGKKAIMKAQPREESRGRGSLCREMTSWEEKLCPKGVNSASLGSSRETPQRKCGCDCSSTPRPRRLENGKKLRAPRVRGPRGIRVIVQILGGSGSATSQAACEDGGSSIENYGQTTTLKPRGKICSKKKISGLPKGGETAFSRTK